MLTRWSMQAVVDGATVGFLSSIAFQTSWWQPFAFIFAWAVVRGIADVFDQSRGLA